MNRDHPLWLFILKRLNAGQEVMLLVVAESAGSSPGRVGFKLAADKTGAICGSIGGGIMEVKLVELAVSRLQKGLTSPLVKRQIHRNTAKADRSGMICSGEQTVLFFGIKPTDLPPIQRISSLCRNHKPAVLEITPGQIQVLMGEQSGAEYPFVRLPDNTFRYSENIGLKHRVHIVGGGHCGLALSKLMQNLDFYVCLYDDRPGLESFAKNRFAHKKYLIANYAQLERTLPAGPNEFVAVMTLGYRSDETVIRALIHKDFGYFGVLGSKAKMAGLLDKLKKEGIPAERLERVSTPAGLPIMSRTPEEIAVSIAAEIIRVKNAG